MNQPMRVLTVLALLCFGVAMLLLVRVTGLSVRGPEPSDGYEPMPLQMGLAQGSAQSPRAVMALSGQGAAPAAAIKDSWQGVLADLEKARGAVPSELLLEFHSAAAMAEFLQRLTQAGIRVLARRDDLLLARVGFGGRAAALAAELSRGGGSVSRATPNYQVWVPGMGQAPQPDPNNAGGQSPVGERALEMIGVAGQRSDWGRGVRVAVLDSGVLAHDSLKNVSVLHEDFVRDGQVFHGHGTAMASLIAGNDREVPSYGIAQGVTLLDGRVADGRGMGHSVALAEAVLWAVEQGAAVINISLGSSGDSPWVARAIALAQSKGVIVVAAAGNDRSSTLDFPAAYPSVLAVGAVDAHGRQAYFSNSGQGLFIAAPGVSVPSAYDGNRRVVGSGTSQAAAMVSAAAAVFLWRGMQPAQVPAAMAAAATSTGAPTSQVGSGILWLAQ
jgi:thermitase